MALSATRLPASDSAATGAAAAIDDPLVVSDMAFLLKVSFVNTPITKDIINFFKEASKSLGQREWMRDCVFGR